jgi:hypothetical protein
MWAHVIDSVMLLSSCADVIEVVESFQLCLLCSYDRELPLGRHQDRCVIKDRRATGMEERSLNIR